MDNVELITTVIVTSAPAMASIIGCVTAFLKIKKNNQASNSEILECFNDVKVEVMKTKEYEALKRELLIAHEENRALKKQINTLLTKIDKIARE